MGNCLDKREEEEEEEMGEGLELRVEREES
jgi:hypothetical protein